MLEVRILPGEPFHCSPMIWISFVICFFALWRTVRSRIVRSLDPGFDRKPPPQGAGFAQSLAYVPCLCSPLRRGRTHSLGDKSDGRSSIFRRHDGFSFPLAQCEMEGQSRRTRDGILGRIWGPGRNIVEMQNMKWLLRRMS